MKKALILSLAANVFILSFLVIKRWYYTGGNKKIHAYDYAANPQYMDHLSIVPAYNSPCEIAFIGDSHLSRCRLDELLGRPVCNRGVGNDITEGVYNRIGTVLKARPKICFILCGANDIAYNIPLDRTLGWYRKIVDALKVTGIKPVVMLPTHPRSDYPGQKEYVERLNELNNELAALADHIKISTTDEDIQADGTHLNASGYKKWAAVIKDFLAHLP